MKPALNILKRLALLQRQMGNLSGSVLFYLRGVDGWAKDIEKTAYLEMIKTELADVHQQCLQLCIDLDFNFSEITLLGQKRYDEAKRNFVKKNKLEYWI